MLARVDVASETTLEDTAGVDITPCHDADGTWNPTSACDEFPRDAERRRGHLGERLQRWPAVGAGAELR